MKKTVINTKDPKIRKIVKSKKSKIWGVLKLLDEIWDIKEPSSEKVKIIIRDYFGDILKGKRKTEANELVIGIVEYLRDVTGLKLKEWEKAEKSLIEVGVLKKGGIMNIREIIKEKGRWEAERKGRKKGSPRSYFKYVERKDEYFSYFQSDWNASKRD